MDPKLQKNARDFWRARLKDHYTYRELGDRLGVEVSVMRKRLTGLKPITLDVVTLFMELTGASLETVLGLDDSAPPTLAELPGYAEAESAIRAKWQGIAEDDWTAIRNATISGSVRIETVTERFLTALLESMGYAFES